MKPEHSANYLPGFVFVFNLPRHRIHYKVYVYAMHNLNVVAITGSKLFGC